MGELIGFAFAALVRALTFTAAALAALVLAALAVVAAAVGLVAMVLANLARIAADMLRALGSISAELAKVALVAALVVVMVWAFPAVWRAYGGDVPALLPACVVTVVPMMYGATFKPVWPGLVFAMTAAGLAGLIVPLMHPVALALLAGGARAVGVLEILNQQEERHEQQVG